MAETVQQVADTYITVQTPFGKIELMPGDLYNVDGDGYLKEASRKRYSNGIYTWAMLELQLSQDPDGWVDPGDTIPV